MSFTKTKYDSCEMNQQQQNNKSIFSYVVDNAMYINNNECNNYTAPFLTYIPSGISTKSEDVENDLKGMTRPYSKCATCKFTPDVTNTTPKLNENNKKECARDYNILPDGYFQRQ